MRYTLFTLMLLACPLALAGPVYKWVDENGVVHYSDQPHENAEKIHVAAPQTYKASQYPQAQNPNAAAAAAAAPAPGPVGYHCAVTAPADQQNFQNVETVGVGVAVDPPQSTDDQLFLMLDGRVVPGQPTAGQQFTLRVERGEHSLAVVIRDAAGKVACSSASVTFFVRQASLLAPANPLNPANQPPPSARPH